jgi:hypothetical protein
MPRLLTLLVLLFSATLALADPAPPTAIPGIRITDFGVYCRPDSEGTEPAPETSLGYINLLSALPEFVHRQQDIPATMGTSFGVVVQADRDILQARIETWKPGRDQPEIWYTDLFADTPRMRGFAFDFPEEVILGTWRMEAWDGDTRLYSVEFEVRPAESLPGISSDCNLLS